MEEDGETILREENLYQLLNIPQTATQDEISSAYRKFSRMFHPDKHAGDPNRQKWAEKIFNKVKEAYEILSDPHKRAIYDTLGKRGVEVDGWEVIFRTRTPREIREEYERLKREKEERMLQQSTNPRGTISLSINATDLFMKYDDLELDELSGFPSIEVSGMSIHQSIDSPISMSDTVTLSGNISTQNGIGSGAVTVSNKRLTSERGWAEMDLSIGNGPSFGFKMFRTLNRLMYCTGGTSLHFTSRGITPSLVSTLAVQLDSHAVGYLTYRTGGGSGSSMTTMYVRDVEKFHMTAAVQLGNPHSFISLSVTHKMPDRQMKVRLAFKAGTFGAVAEYGAEKKVSQHTSVSAAIMVGVPTGVMLKLKWTRATQTIIVPIHLSEEVVPAPVFYATLAPVIGWLLVRKLYLDPAAKRHEDRERKRARDANKERLIELQQHARATIELMKETYARIKADEEKKKGLVIIKAVYGKLPGGRSSHVVETESAGDTSSPSPSTPPPDVIDVTIPLQCLVKDSRLQLLPATKADLPGFYDPCVGDDKHLTCQYSFHGGLYCCTVADAEPLTLPRQNHRCSRKS